MPKAAVPAAISEMTRVSRVRVQVRADAFIYEGYVHLLAETRRIQEVLNDPKPFLNLTEVVIHDTSLATTNHAPYVALNKGAITHVVILAGDTTGQDISDTSAQAGPSLGGGSGIGAAPMLPSVGPRTMPGPEPTRRRRSDPPTQPFPPFSGSDDVSDLILDDDGGDDIDPDDLERDVGP